MSGSDMLKAAEAEVEQLEKQLEATPAYQKLQLAKKVVDLYRQTEGIAPLSGNTRQTLSANADPIVAAAPKPYPWATKTQRIETTAVEYLKKKASRAPAANYFQP